MFEEKMKEYSVGMCKMSLPSDKTVFQVMIERFFRA